MIFLILCRSKLGLEVMKFLFVFQVYILLVWVGNFKDLDWLVIIEWEENVGNRYRKQVRGRYRYRQIGIGIFRQGQICIDRYRGQVQVGIAGRYQQVQIGIGGRRRQVQCVGVGRYGGKRMGRYRRQFRFILSFLFFK